MILVAAAGKGMIARHAAAQFAAQPSGSAGGSSALAAAQSTSATPQPADGAVIGRLEIPALDLVVPIISNYDATSLTKGVGHIPGTAVPGGLGTVGLAGHRDTYFRPLRRIKDGMDVRLVDSTGTYHYRVDSTEVVTPDRVDVLDIGNIPSMTLVTCYPFNFIGAAPKRFIVRAHLISVAADGQ